MKNIRILVVDDHAVVRKGLILLLEDDPRIEIVGEAADGLEAIEKVQNLLPDIVFLDISMPHMNGLQVAGVLHERFPTVKTLIFSMHHNTDYILAAVENGADGYLLKDTSKQEITLAVEALAKGEKYYPPAISSVIVNALVHRPKANAQAPEQTKSLVKLSKRERIILRMIANGMSSREIAEHLKLSIRTVSNHRANIIKKTKARNTAELVKMAVQEDKI